MRTGEEPKSADWRRWPPAGPCRTSHAWLRGEMWPLTSTPASDTRHSWPLAVAAEASETGAAAMHTLLRHHPLSLSGDVPLSVDTVTQQPRSY